MMLEPIVKSTLKRYENADPSGLKIAPPSEPFRFKKALKGGAVIAEVKKASPSKGLIDPIFDYKKIAAEYEEAGAAAVSVLTEPEFFKGKNEYLKEIRQLVKIPVLRKDFTLTEYQIYEAAALGADAVLLIAAILSPEKLKEYLKLAESLGLCALTEAHTEAEVLTALEAGAEIIGINNRDLNTFKTDIKVFVRLAGLIPDGIIKVAESGITSAEDAALLKSAGADAFLIGEALMRSADKKAAIRELAL